ncbi:hypothetical protein HMPREF1257_01967 [Corynebacterium sp. KPL1814]|nr:hypothetical protein HMPREF1281_01724 [Corynebacterium sp. KPL1855]ERS61607.1 hypothetical protein HMPREF1257_01967 [Corynebacterium sp. KPL1814]ERS79898.1 hypothetical protein HMPREF1285_01113 [Corynebacterium sp. KPL1859]
MTCDLMTRAPRTGAHRPAQQTALAPEPAGHPHRTPHYQSQVPAQVGPTPHRLPPGHPPVDRGASPQTLPDAEPRLHRPGHWPAGEKADAGALRARRPRGAMVHVDIKKLGRIPDGGGWRMFGRGSDQDRASGRASDVAGRKGSKPGRGYRYLHHAVDGHSRVVHSEILDDEHKDTAAGFWRRASGFFASLGVRVGAVMTDNGACYRSRVFVEALGPGIKHR